MRPFFCYYGGKWRAAPKYPQPEHETIVEPFAGAAGYATRYHDRRIVLVERDPAIAELWRYLIGVSAEEVRAIPILGMDQTVDDLHGTAHAARLLVGFWLSHGSAQPKRSPSAWMRQGIRPKSFWCETVRERIASQVERIRHWQIIEGDYEQAPDIEATWFVDPPYEVAGKRYRCRIGDYGRLSQWVLERRGLVIACENEGAQWLPFRPFAAIKANASRTGGKVSLEAIYVQRSAA